MSKHQTRAKPIAIYARISKDRAGRSEGVKDQERWGREYVKENWPRADVLVFADNDLSAADDTVYRPRYEELRQAIRRGDISRLWTVEQSRLTRLEIEWFSLTADLVKAGIEEVHTRRNGIVQVGEVVAGINAVLDAHEVRRNRKRIRDKHAALAAEGRPSGRPGYGYRKARDKQGRPTYEIHKAEAAIIREIAERICRGDSLISIGEDLTRRKIRTSRGGKWHTSTLIGVVTKPQVAGLRAHNGEPLVKAVWPPILERKQWDKVRAVLRKTERTVTGTDGAKHLVNTRHRLTQRHLLTGGIAVCGRCGSPLTVQTARARSDRSGMKRATYSCPSRDRGGCSRLSILKDDLDKWITELVQFSFLGSDVDKALAKQKDDPRTPLLKEIGRLQRELDDFDRLRGQNKISHRRWLNISQELEAQLRAVELKLRSLPTDGVTIGTSSAAIVNEWDTYTLAQKQRVIRLLWSEIRILPADHPDVERRPLKRKLKGAGGRRTFDPRRIKFVSASGRDRMAIDDKVIAGLIEAISD